jgi:uncharacterized membrane protein
MVAKYGLGIILIIEELHLVLVYPLVIMRTITGNYTLTCVVKNIRWNDVLEEQGHYLVYFVYIATLV